MSATADFFDELARRGHEPLLRRVSARVRFDTGDGDRPVHRLVTIEHGDLRVSEADGAPADATLTCSQSELDALASGRTSAMASLLRGALTVQGDPELVVLAQRLFSRRPTPSGRHRKGEGHE
ncbi:SCP2 sterol-binding domain-containing protein [Terrabacter sp. NPDC080008]|uniref:SCP2 sterol-binding domain-containing protein n=1 Tax=Terrabacter sp. NPDC080008 TaxID=3155176 RepID=UPI00344D0E1F